MSKLLFCLLSIKLCAPKESSDIENIAQEGFAPEASHTSSHAQVQDAKVNFRTVYAQGVVRFYTICNQTLRLPKIKESREAYKFSTSNLLHGTSQLKVKEMLDEIANLPKDLPIQDRAYCLTSDHVMLLAKIAGIRAFIDDDALFEKFIQRYCRNNRLDELVKLFEYASSFRTPGRFFSVQQPYDLLCNMPDWVKSAASILSTTIGQIKHDIQNADTRYYFEMLGKTVAFRPGKESIVSRGEQVEDFLQLMNCSTSDELLCAVKKNYERATESNFDISSTLEFGIIDQAILLSFFLEKNSLLLSKKNIQKVAQKFSLEWFSLLLQDKSFQEEFILEKISELNEIHYRDTKLLTMQRYISAQKSISVTKIAKAIRNIDTECCVFSNVSIAIASKSKAQRESEHLKSISVTKIAKEIRNIYTEYCVFSEINAEIASKSKGQRESEHPRSISVTKIAEEISDIDTECCVFSEINVAIADKSKAQREGEYLKSIGMIKIAEEISDIDTECCVFSEINVAIADKSKAQKESEYLKSISMIKIAEEISDIDTECCVFSKINVAVTSKSKARREGEYLKSLKAMLEDDDLSAGEE